MRVGPHGCDLHPRPVPRPFVALLYEFQ
jgi:hypothetical protein